VRAILLAAGQGLRLQYPPERQLPKCLLRFGGVSLLERHWRLLTQAGIDDIVLAVGFRREMIEEEIERLAWRPRLAVNERYELGSVLTVHTVTDALTAGGEVLLMDADVLYHAEIMARLVDGAGPINRLLIDRHFDAGEEPVKVCVRNGTPIELRKQLAPELQYDTIGESIGFFRLDESAALRFAELVCGYIDSSRAHLPHEEAVRDLIQEGSHPFDAADVTGIPWMEIDFAADVMRAERDVLPRLNLPARSLPSAVPLPGRGPRVAQGE